MLAIAFAIGDMQPGARVDDRYELERVLGEGGSAVVWAARDEKSGERVALKLIKTDHDLRVTREARAAMSIQHPSVVRIRDVGTDAGKSYLVMDLLEGETLDKRLARDGALGLPAFGAIFSRVIAAVAAAHALGIVHRDLKPANIFLMPEGDVRVLDFGLAKLTATQEGSNVTATGDRLGTPRYMSPEQVQGRRDVDHRADLWSLGILFYEALSGQHPIARGTLAQMFDQITRSEIRPLSEVAPSVPTELAAVVHRLLSRDRTGRPELVEVLDIVRAHAPGVDANLELPSARVSEPEPWRHEPTADETAYPPKKPPKRGSFLLYAIVFVVLATAAVVAVVIRQ